MTGRENSEAITAVIEKLTEIVGSNESTQDGFERHTDVNDTEESCDGKKNGEVENLPDAGQASKPTNAVLTNVQNLLPADCKSEGVGTQPLSGDGSLQKGKVISSEQMVLNFPIKLANLNIASPQGLLETLQKLNAKLKVGMKDVDVVRPQEEKHVKEEETEDCEMRMLFKCTKCNYSSHNKHYLKQHTGLVHNAERLYKCPFCDYAGKRSYSLKEHLIVHSTYRPYECSYCNASFRKKGHLTNHVKMHSSQKTLACVLCHVSVQSRMQLYEHLRQDHDADSVYVCDVCEYATAIKSNIVMHMHTHGDPKVYKCLGCQFTAPHVNIIQQHLKAIHRDNGTTYSVERAPDKPGPVILMKCSECGYTCTNKDVLKDHILQQHIDVSDLMEGLQEGDGDIGGEQANRYKCVQCNYTSSEAYPFITHILSHKPKVPLTQALQEEGDQTKALTTDDTANSAAAATSGTVVVPRQRFTHDASNGMYRCAICNYTCEFQRTIKAHIWKHSGHKDIDYPMFQNGPLSVYDDTPVGMSILLSSKAPVSHVASSSVTDRNTIVTARPISIAPKKSHVTKTSAETSGKPPTPKPEDGTSADKFKADPSIQKAIVRISSKGPVMVILSAAEKKKQQQLQEKAATASTDVLVKEKVKMSTSGVSSDNVSCPGADHPAKPTSQKVFQTALVKTTHRPPVTVATTVHIVQSPASRTPPVSSHKAPVVAKQTQKPEADGLKRDEVVSTLSAGSTDVLTNSGCKRKLSEDARVADDENLHVVKKRSAEGSCLVIPPEISGQTKGGGKSDAAGGSIPKFNLTKVLASSDVCEDVKVVPETIRGVVDNVDKTGETEDCEQQNSDKENMVNPKNAENTKGKTSSTDTAALTDANSIHDEACCSTVSCDKCGETPTNEDGSKPNAGICQSLLAVIEQLRSRSESESDDIGVDGSTGGMKRKRKLSGEWPGAGSEHMEICDGQYRCRLCHYKSTSAAVVGVHMRLHKEKPPSECSLCDFQSDTSESLQEHMLQHCKLRTYQCRLCNSTFNYKSQLRAHMRAHIGMQSDVCKLCGFAAADATALTSHMDTHAKSGEIRQSVKTEEEQQEADEQHIDGDKDGKQDTESGDKSETYRMVPHKCDTCGFTTTSQTYLAEHQHRQHGVDDKELECELCEFVATSVRSLKSHMKRHVNDQRFVLQPLEQYKCNLCGYVCHHLPSLKSHMWRHASDSNYSYESTNNIINAAIDFDMQRCVKRPPKEYRCNMCGYVCYHMPSLKSHMWRHSSDQNYHYKFMTDDFLNSFAVSQLSHDGKSVSESVLPLVTFRCCQCGFESTDKAQLSNHMVVHADDSQVAPAQESVNVSDGDVEMVAVEECVEEVTVTTCVQ